MQVNTPSHRTLYPPQHHAWAKEACIDFFAVSWGGDGTRAPKGGQGVVSATCSLVNSKGVHTRPECHKEGSGERVELERGHEYKVQQAGWLEPLQWWSPSGDVDTLIMRHLEIGDGVPMALMYELRDVLVCWLRLLGYSACLFS